MAEIIGGTWDGGGNVPPAMAIARELADRGHGIRVLGHRGQRDAIEGAGFTAVATTHARDFRAGDPHSTRDLLATFGDRGMARDLLDELRRRPADLVLVDADQPGAGARAEGQRHRHAAAPQLGRVEDTRPARPVEERLECEYVAKTLIRLPHSPSCRMNRKSWKTSNS